MSSFNDIIAEVGSGEYNAGKVIVQDGDSQDVIAAEAATWNDAMLARADAILNP